MAAGARWTLPPAAATSNRTLYFFRGSALRVAGEPVAPYHAVELRADVSVPLENGPDESELLLLQGRPIAEPVAQYGPFVMNTRGEVQQAFADYQRTEFGGWPWPSDDPVHPRPEGRFARHAGGKLERAG
jgi:redox-sensitive bicupin YhaK (pirin superfamily)